MSADSSTPSSTLGKAQLDLQAAQQRLACAEAGLVVARRTFYDTLALDPAVREVLAGGPMWNAMRVIGVGAIGLLGLTDQVKSHLQPSDRLALAALFPASDYARGKLAKWLGSRDSQEHAARDRVKGLRRWARGDYAA